MRCTSIVSAYFCESWLEGRIINLLEQTLVPNIIAVCQKGSEEQKLLSKFPQVLILTTPDIPTVYVAWNMAISAVETPFINIANSDDRLLPTGIEEMCYELETNKEIGLVFPDLWVVYEYNGEYRSELVPSDTLDMFDGCFIGCCPTYRTELHKLYGLYPEEYVVAGDYWMWLNFHVHGVKFKHIHKKLGVWYDRSHDPSVEKNLEFRMSNLTVWESAKAKDFWRKKCQ